VWWTTLAFAVVTALLVYSHVRAGSKGRVNVEIVCPRCKVRVPKASSRCPSCGIPPQVFELAAAPAAAPSAVDPSAKPRRPHAVVRADMCVGCGTCVAACPEPGALTLVGKLAVVDPAKCTGHGNCEGACPVGAIVVTTDAAVQRIEVPDLSLEFETSVPGLFIVGELGGRGLIKNAINEGKIAVEAIAERVRARRGAPTGVAGAGPYDVLIVGSGPAGLSAGLEAIRHGLRYLVLEQGAAADSIRRYPRHKLLLAEPVELPLYGNLFIKDGAKEALLAVWEQAIAQSGLALLTGHRVTDVGRTGGVFTVATDGASFAAHHVILAMGRRGSPRRLDVKGEDLTKVVYDVAEMETFRGRRVLVVGGGDSAIESALGLIAQPGTEVILCHRADDFPRIKERNRMKLDDARAQGRLRVLMGSRVLEIRRDAVALNVQGTPEIVPNDDVIVRVGGVPPNALLEKIGVRRVVKELRLEPAAS
jgi:thioredoxin reductase (NADPH)